MGHRLSKSRWPETIAAILIPPARREEVLGDLHERNATSLQYVLDALCTVPLVIVSRIRRTSDARFLALHAVILYFAFFWAAWQDARSFLYEPWSLGRMAIPCAAAILALVLEDAYTKPGGGSRLWFVRGPMFAVASAFISQAAIGAGASSLVLPATVVIRGGFFALSWMLLIRVGFQRRSRSRRGSV